MHIRDFSHIYCINHNDAKKTCGYFYRQQVAVLIYFIMQNHKNFGLEGICNVCSSNLCVDLSYSI